MRIAIGIVAFTLLTGTSAFAADMPMSVPTAAAPIQAVNWTGFYIGGNAGGVIAHPSGTSDFTDTSLPPGFEFTDNPVAEQPAKGGFVGGGQAGVNWQFSRILVGGLEADWDWMSAKYSFCRQNIGGSNACNELGVGGGFQTIDSKTPWLATFRGRFGVAWQNWLFYGTGGAAIGRITTDLTMNCPFGCGFLSSTPIFTSSTSTTTRTGWVAGLGAELMLARNWTARAEFLYVDLGTISNALPTVGNSGGIQTASWSRNETFDEFRLGVSYLFH
ncbi:MAG: outer membrane beta-barrel protein [Xanthobacteraceae bacterium]